MLGRPKAAVFINDSLTAANRPTGTFSTLPRYKGRWVYPNPRKHLNHCERLP